MTIVLSDHITGEFRTTDSVKNTLMRLCDQSARDTLDTMKETGLTDDKFESHHRRQLNRNYGVPDHERWHPLSFASEIQFYAEITFDDGSYFLNPKEDLSHAVDAPLVIHGPSPRSNADWAKSVTITLSRGGKVSALQLHYPMHIRPLHWWVSEPFMLINAMSQVQKKGSAPGVDEISPHEVNPSFCWDLAKELWDDHCEPDPLRLVLVPKGRQSEKIRPLNIPTVRDRIIQKSMYEVLNAFYEPQFSEYSYGFRPGRNSFQAITKLREWMDKRYRWVVSVDLKDAFENVPHPVIRRIITSDTGDKKLADWIIRQLRTISHLDREASRKALGRDIPEKWESWDGMERTKGVPQGGPVSSVVFNAVLNRFDQWCENNSYPFIRYADDMVLLARSKAKAEEFFRKSVLFFEDLEMPVNEKKSEIINAYKDPVEFLGFEIDRGVIKPSRENIENCKAMIKESLEHESLAKASKRAQSWGEYFKQTASGSVNQKLEEWFSELLENTSSPSAINP
ncbi:MAG: reverse transcriptase domain-containing protein [bacterium]